MMTRSPRRLRIFHPAGLLRRTLRRRGLEVATRSILLAGIVLSTAYVIASSTYEASLLMRVEVLLDDEGQPRNVTAGTVETLARLVASRGVLDVAAEDPSLADLPWFRRVVRAERLPGVPMIRVAARGTPDQAPRIVDAVVTAFERLQVRAQTEAQGEVRDEAAARLVGLRARSVEIERTWKDYAERKAAGRLGLRLDEVDLHDLANERVAVRLGIAEAERQRVAPEPSGSGHEEIRRVSAVSVCPLPVGLAWFWLAAGLVPVLAPAGVLGLAMVAEARRIEAEARKLRAWAGRDPSSQGPLLIAIQLAHGDWRPRPVS